MRPTGHRRCTGRTQDKTTGWSAKRGRLTFTRSGPEQQKAVTNLERDGLPDGIMLILLKLAVPPDEAVGVAAEHFEAELAQAYPGGIFHCLGIVPDDLVFGVLIDAE